MKYKYLCGRRDGLISPMQVNEWVQVLAFRGYYKNPICLNRKMQGHNKLIIDVYDCIRPIDSFWAYVPVWKMQLPDNNTANLSTLKLQQSEMTKCIMIDNVMTKYSSKISNKRMVHFWTSKDFRKILQHFWNPSSTVFLGISEDIQMEIID